MIASARVAEFIRIGKSRNAILVLVIILVGSASFGLGRLSKIEEEKGSLSISNAVPMQNPFIAAASEGIPSKISQNETLEGTYVASRNGKTYTLPTCSGAKAIAEQNKIWFGTKEEAEAAGYRPAANCKGI
ncbi:MAG TPA: Ada metal-binding domain-containing protein [Candidatus Paceibacterota bacterium]